ncbi:MAG: MerR family transcriptional regulator [Bacteroidales bacterium]|jgi:DNA-binding transcriptional MerR regulator|nr:MerR family transcriptional regulator [Bacteroidales bacterium]
MADKLYYTIGEVSRMFQVNPSLIRFWEKEFSIIHPQKNKKGNRVFTAKDIDNFRLIYNLVKEKGYTIQGARDHLAKHKSEAEKNMEIIKSLQEIRSFLIEVGKELS